MKGSDPEPLDAGAVGVQQGDGAEARVGRDSGSADGAAMR